MPGERASFAALCLPTALLWIAAFLLGAAAHASGTPAQGDPNPSSLEARVGWLDQCLAIKNDALQPGTSVTFLIFDPARTELVEYGTFTHRVAGRIVEKTRSVERCRALSFRINDAPDITFYEVVLDGGLSAKHHTGIGILGLAPDADLIDMNGDGAQESFTLCHTGAGFRFDMWAGEARTGERLWSGTSHFGRSFMNGNCEYGPDFPLVFSLLDLEVGYMDGCLAIRNPTLQPGTPVAVMTIGDGDRFLTDRVLDLRLNGTIVAKTTSDEHCPPLSEMRRIESEGFTFYTVALQDGPLMHPEEDGVFGIGIVGLPQDTQWIDLDGNGRADSFTACKYYEGLEFVIWSGAPYGGEQLWNEYYYLGYETDEIECPLSPPDSGPDLSGPPRTWDPVFRVGWVVAGCLGIDNEQLPPGTPIGIMTHGTADPKTNRSGVLQKRIAGSILSKGGSGEECPGINPLVREWNQRRGFAFYPIGLEDGRALDPSMFGIGIVQPEPEEASFDLDRNGQPDGFAVCYGWGENMNFAIWSGRPIIAETPDAEALSSDALAKQLVWNGQLYIRGRLMGVPDCPGDP
jgi:hypothetical protein